MSDTWLLVFWGDADWPDLVRTAVELAAPQHPDAHTILSCEHDGPRWSLLLVHWSETERDKIIGSMRPAWDDVFVNSVADLGDDVSTV